MEQNIPENWDEIEGLLAQELRPEQIKTRQGDIRYLPTHFAVANANRIFGTAGWSFEIEKHDEVYGPEHLNMETGEIEKKLLGFECWIRLRIHGVKEIPEYGFVDVPYPRNGNAPSIGVIIMAKKGAISDALRRALHYLGPPFGLDLYDEDWRPEGDGQPQQQRQANNRRQPVDNERRPAGPERDPRDIDPNPPMGKEPEQEEEDPLAGVPSQTDQYKENARLYLAEMEKMESITKANYDAMLKGLDISTKQATEILGAPILKWGKDNLGQGFKGAAILICEAVLD